MKKQLIVGLLCIVINPSTNAMMTEAAEQEDWKMLRQLSMEQRQLFTTRLQLQEILSAVEMSVQITSNHPLHQQLAHIEQHVVNQQQSINVIASKLYRNAIITSLLKIETELQQYCELYEETPQGVFVTVQDPDTLFNTVISMDKATYFVKKIVQLQKLKENLQDQLDKLNS